MALSSQFEVLDWMQICLDGLFGTIRRVPNQHTRLPNLKGNDGLKTSPESNVLTKERILL